MPTVIQFTSPDASDYTNKYYLPGTLGSGLQALYFFDRGLTRTLTNLAPGGVQGATFVGSPTINGNGTMTLSASGYLQTPIMETTELTVMMTVDSQAPVDGTTSILFGNIALDTGRSPQTNAGIQALNNTSSTSPDGKLTMSTYFGNTGDNPATNVQLSTSLDIPAWRTPSLLYIAAGTSSERGILGSQTLGTFQQTPLQTKPRFINLALPFRVGMNYGTTPAGSVRVGVFAYYIPSMGQRAATAPARLFGIGSGPRR